MAFVLISPPAVEPVTLAEMKLQLGLSPMEDTLHVKAQMLAQKLRGYIRTARQECENRTRRVFITQTWQMALNGWPSRNEVYGWQGYPQILLPKPPLQQLLSFTYVDTAGNLQNMIAPVLADGQTQNGSSNPLNFTAPVYNCQVNDASSETQPGRIAPPFALPWPPIRLIPDNIVLTFICGYGDTGDTVPAAVTQAILFLAHSYYDPTAFKDVDKLVNSLLASYVYRES